jgi:hypothetical protein
MANDLPLALANCLRVQCLSYAVVDTLSVFMEALINDAITVHMESICMEENTVS